jgi:hypothetical protein
VPEPKLDMEQIDMDREILHVAIIQGEFMEHKNPDNGHENERTFSALFIKMKYEVCVWT